MKSIQDAIWHIKQAIFVCADIAQDISEDKKPIEELPNVEVSSLLLRCIDLLGQTTYEADTKKELQLVLDDHIDEGGIVHTASNIELHTKKAWN
jgi:hypothetical protein